MCFRWFGYLVLSLSPSLSLALSSPLAFVYSMQPHVTVSQTENGRADEHRSHSTSNCPANGIRESHIADNDSAITTSWRQTLATHYETTEFTSTNGFVEDEGLYGQRKACSMDRSLQLYRRRLFPTPLSLRAPSQSSSVRVAVGVTNPSAAAPVPAAPIVAGHINRVAPACSGRDAGMNKMTDPEQRPRPPVALPSSPPIAAAAAATTTATTTSSVMTRTVDSKRSRFSQRTQQRILPVHSKPNHVPNRFQRQTRTVDTRNTTNTPVHTGRHIVCALSENLARETCVASIDTGAPTTLIITKQGNGQTYSETIAYLELLQPDEILFNEGRQHSPLARKIQQLYPQSNKPLNFGTINAVSIPHRAPKRPRRPQRLEQQQEQQMEHNDEEQQPQSDSRFGGLHSQCVIKFISRSCFDQTRGAEVLRRLVRPEMYNTTVVEEYNFLSASHAVLQYTQLCLGVTLVRHTLQLNVLSGGTHRMAMDRSTILQLELLVNAKSGKVSRSLIGTLDHTKTTVGSRLLRINLMSPPTRMDTIQTRLEMVDMFLADEDFFFHVMEHLLALPDVDKMLAHVAIQINRTGSVITAQMARRGVSALVCIKTTLLALPSLGRILSNHLQSLEERYGGGGTIDGNEKESPFDTKSLHTDRSSLGIGLGNPGGSIQRFHLLRAILYTIQQPALETTRRAVTDILNDTITFTRNANAMRHQECFALKCDDADLMSVLRQAFLGNVDDIYRKADEYAEIYGFPVQVRHSTTRGYFLTVPSEVGNALPSVFIQPTKSRRSIACTTEEIASLNNRAQDNMHDLILMTHDRIQEVLEVARSNYDALAAVCDAVALLDMCHSFADTVTLSRQTWCRPIVTDSDKESVLMIRNGRFAIDVGSTRARNGNQGFIPNDTYVSLDKPFTVITGINGSGKSTYLNQVATLVILAQCGSYVPAEAASVPIRDRLCCRIGNADDQENNISTFLLEMKETAFICNHATERSLVLIDELGRATSNDDGVAISWAVCEYLLKKRCLTFFVTHYPQLTRLCDSYPHRVQNVHMVATVGGRNLEGDIHYTHRLQTGACPVSMDYGVELAVACGWPLEVVQVASQIQKEAEAFLPEHGLCHTGPNHVSHKAASVVGEIHHNLQKFVSGEEMFSIASIRTKMDELQDKIRHQCEDDELRQWMERLLHMDEIRLPSLFANNLYSSAATVERSEIANPNRSNAMSVNTTSTTSLSSSTDSSSDEDEDDSSSYSFTSSSIGSVGDSHGSSCSP